MPCLSSFVNFGFAFAFILFKLIFLLFYPNNSAVFIFFKCYILGSLYPSSFYLALTYCLKASNWSSTLEWFLIFSSYCSRSSSFFFIMICWMFLQSFYLMRSWKALMSSSPNILARLSRRISSLSSSWQILFIFISSNVWIVDFLRFWIFGFLLLSDVVSELIVKVWLFFF